jgi:hypothetical protein
MISRNYRKRVVITTAATMLCILLCSSTIFYGLSSHSSIVTRALLTDASAQVSSGEGSEIVDEPSPPPSSSPSSSDDEDEQDEQEESPSPPSPPPSSSPPSPPANIAPIAVASAFPQNAKSNQLVTLDASLSSDPDNGPQPLKYAWTVVSPVPEGGTIMLQPNPNVAKPTFTAPQVLDSSITLRFQLIVNDGQADSAPVYVDVIVSPAGMPQQQQQQPLTTTPPPPSADTMNDTINAPLPSNNTTTPAIDPAQGLALPPPTSKGTLTVITKVVYTGGGAAPATIAKPSDFTIRVYASNSVPFESQGSESGTSVSFDAGRYEVEVYQQPGGYLQEFSGDCSGNIDAAAAAAEDQAPKVCTITNTLTGNVEFTSTLRVNVNINPTPPEPLDFQIQVIGTPANPAKYGVVISDVKNIKVVGGRSYEVIAQQPVEGFSISYNATYSDGCKGSIIFQETKECTITYIAAPQEANIGKLVVTGKVINDNEGRQTAFGVRVNGNTTTPSSFNTADGSVTEVSIRPGQYNVTQQQQPPASNYTTTFSGDCDSTTGAGTIAAGELRFCTIIFNDAPPGGLSKGTLYVATSVFNDGSESNGNDFPGIGSKSGKDFNIQVTGNNNPSPSLFSGVSSLFGPNRIINPKITVILDPGIYSVRASQDTGNTSIITFPDGQRYSYYFEGDCQNIDIKAGQEKTCIVWFSDEPNVLSQPRTLNMLAFGDSVMWGQGLLEEQKFHSLVANEIKAKYPSIFINKQVYAHSGAAIGGSVSTPIPYLFRWEDAPGQDSQKVRDYICNIGRIPSRPYVPPPTDCKTAPLMKLDGDKTIKMGPYGCITPPRGGTPYACKEVYIRLDGSGTTATLEGTGMLLRKLPGKYIDGKLYMFENSALVNDYIFGGHRYHGEIPKKVPSILHQVEEYRGPPEPDKVNLILLDGCINDVGATTRLLDDQISHSHLASVIYNACYTDMKTLVQKVSSKFPNAIIIVTGYFPAISEYNLPWVRDLITLLSEDFRLNWSWEWPPGWTIDSDVNTDVIISHWALWHRDSNALIGKVVQESVDPANKRIFFVDPKFGPENVAFGPRALLYHYEGFAFAPMAVDPLKELRKAVCNQELPRSTDMTERIGCHVASLSHPTADGAKQYATEIMKVLDNGVLSNMLMNIPPDPPTGTPPTDG